MELIKKKKGMQLKKLVEEIFQIKEIEGVIWMFALPNINTYIKYKVEKP